MISIRFADRDAEKRALAFMLGRFSGQLIQPGEHSVSQAALEALSAQNIPFTRLGKDTDEQQLAALRGAAPSAI